MYAEVTTSYGTWPTAISTAASQSSPTTHPRRVAAPGPVSPCATSLGPQGGPRSAVLGGSPRRSRTWCGCGRRPSSGTDGAGRPRPGRRRRRRCAASAAPSPPRPAPHPPACPTGRRPRFRPSAPPASDPHRRHHVPPDPPTPPALPTPPDPPSAPSTHVPPAHGPRPRVERARQAGRPWHDRRLDLGATGGRVASHVRPCPSPTMGAHALPRRTDRPPPSKWPHTPTPRPAHTPAT